MKSKERDRERKKGPDGSAAVYNTVGKVTVCVCVCVCVRTRPCAQIRFLYRNHPSKSIANTKKHFKLCSEFQQCGQPGKTETIL